MQYGKLRGLDKPVSRYIMGTMGFTDFKKFDEYFEQLDTAFQYGITTIDTAMGYGRGVCEAAIGQWLKARRCREAVVITTKGCHPLPWRNRVTWYDLSSDLADSLVKLGTDYIDVYYLHRDDPTVPVSEIMDALAAHFKAGRLRAIGVANWQYERIREANDYARSKGLPEIVIAEEHYSIAEQIADPFGRGSGSISGPRYAEARAYFEAEDMPIASYSTLSGGFVTGRITRELVKTRPETIVEGTRKAYCHEVNFRRLDRTAELAREKGVSIAQIGLAYAMSGPLDVYPIIGAANEAEIISSIEALELKLTKAERDWIDLISDER